MEFRTQLSGGMVRCWGLWSSEFDCSTFPACRRSSPCPSEPRGLPEPGEIPVLEQLPSVRLSWDSLELKLDLEAFLSPRSGFLSNPSLWRGVRVNGLDSAADPEHCGLSTFPSLTELLLLALGEEWGRRKELLGSGSGTHEIRGEVLM